MISNLKHDNALFALNAVLVLARDIANRDKQAELEELMDVAEYLPMLMLEPAERTVEFRGQLLGLAARNPDFELAVQRFDKDDWRK
jgi:hypothetical protein